VLNLNTSEDRLVHSLSQLSLHLLLAVHWDPALLPHEFLLLNPHNPLRPCSVLELWVVLLSNKQLLLPTLSNKPSSLSF